MQIPRQPSGHDRGRTAPAAPAPAATVGGVEPLRRHLAALVDELRTVGYWQRLVQARTDLVVAGLLYASPVPVPATPARLAAAGPDEPSLLAAGMDLDRLLADLAPLGSTADGPGEHLERLRGSTARLAARRRHLLGEVESVEVALQDALLLEAERAAEQAERAADQAVREACAGAPQPTA